MELNIIKELQEIQELYKQNTAAGKKKANFLIIGRSGTGKTKLAETCPGPVLVHSFDPGGHRTITKAIDSGHIICDTRFELETPYTPFAYREWEEEFDRLVELGVFEHIGTYIIDSGTKWLDAMMNKIKKDGGHAKKQPSQPDYGLQQVFTAAALHDILALPCNVIITGHIDVGTDEAGAHTFYSILAAGKQKTKIPLNFDEFYRLEAIETSAGLERRLVTEVDERFEARTRIGAGVFDKYEEPNIRELLKKAGYPYEDKVVTEQATEVEE